MTETPEPLARNALLASLALCGGVGLLALKPAMVEPAAVVRTSSAPAASAPPPATSRQLPPRPATSAPRRAPLALTDEQRNAGHNECATPDPGPGYFAEPRHLWKGMIYLPAQGGHTDDGGFDVVMHFHGGSPARKALVGQARGLTLAGFDLGSGSGAYSQPFVSHLLFDDLRASIERALRAHSNRPDAHIRKLALSAWSAGYGAVNAILRRNGPGAVDAVVLLDGFHSGYLPGEGRRIDEQNVAPLVEFARLASQGQRFFYVTHSQIGTDDYASTTQMTDMLLRRLSVRRVAGDPVDDPFGLLTYAERDGFYLRGFGGTDEHAHCDHLRHLGEAARMLEARWGTPPAR